MTDKKLRPFTKREERIGTALVKLMSRANVWTYRMSGGRVRRPMVARVADAAEKRELWPKLVAMYRDYDDYQARTERDIPVVVLTAR